MQESKTSAQPLLKKTRLLPVYTEESRQYFAKDAVLTHTTHLGGKMLSGPLAFNKEIPLVEISTLKGRIEANTRLSSDVRIAFLHIDTKNGAQEIAVDFTGPRAGFQPCTPTTLECYDSGILTLSVEDKAFPNLQVKFPFAIDGKVDLEKHTCLVSICLFVQDTAFGGGATRTFHDKVKVTQNGVTVTDIASEAYKAAEDFVLSADAVGYGLVAFALTPESKEEAQVRWRKSLGVVLNP